MLAPVQRAVTHSDGKPNPTQQLLMMNVPPPPLLFHSGSFPPPIPLSFLPGYQHQRESAVYSLLAFGIKHIFIIYLGGKEEKKKRLLWVSETKELAAL
ncbi:Hypothetical predicted protein, partial [Pelobates cultripes]